MEVVCSGFMPLYVSSSFVQTESNVFASLSDERCLKTKRKAHWKGLVLKGPAEDVLQCPSSPWCPRCGAALSGGGLARRAHPWPWALKGLGAGPEPAAVQHPYPDSSAGPHQREAAGGPSPQQQPFAERRRSRRGSEDRQPHTLGVRVRKKARAAGGSPKVSLLK